MVATECSNCIWKSNQPPCPRLVHNVRLIQRRLGCMLEGLNRKRSLVSLASRKPLKHSRTKSCLSCHQSLCQRPVQPLCLPSHGQNNRCCLHKQQRGNPFLSACHSNSRLMAVVHSKVNSDHCSTSKRRTQHLSGQRIQRVLRIQQIAKRPSNVSAVHQRVHHRSVCLTPNRSSLTICQLETRPTRYPTRTR